MPRYREPFTIFPRKLKSGKTVWYYRTYTPDGERTVARSTGKANKTQAKNYCAELIANGMLYAGNAMSFGAYADGFFSDGSQWLNDKIQASKGKEQAVAQNTLRAYRHNCDDIIVPFFAKMKLCDIRPRHVKNFRAKLIDKGLSNSAINLACTVLKIIFSYAIADKLMIYDPFVSIRQMYTEGRAKNSFSVEELTSMFKNWKENYNRKVFVLVAAVTGMRISEVCAIRSDTLRENYIDIYDQDYGKGLVPVKDGERRKLRICDRLRRIIEEEINKNGGHAFLEGQDTYRNSLYNELGLTKEIRTERKVSFHSLRHFFNTYMLINDVSVLKAKSVMGHSSGKGSMTERYANFQPKHFDDVAALQEMLLEKFLGSPDYVTPHLDC